MSRPVHILWQQHLVYWKWCQHTTSKGVDCYWQVIDHMKVGYGKIKQDYFLAVAILLYEMHHVDTNEMKREKLDGNYTRMLCAALKKSWKTPHKTAAVWPLTSHLKIHQVRWTRHTGHCRKSKDQHSPMDSYTWTPQWWLKQRITYISSVWTQHAARRTCQDHKDWWWERIRELCAVSTTWWW